MPLSLANCTHKQQAEALIIGDYPTVLVVIDLLFKGQNNDSKLESSKQGKKSKSRFQMYHT